MYEVFIALTGVVVGYIGAIVGGAVWEVGRPIRIPEEPELPEKMCPACGNGPLIFRPPNIVHSETLLGFRTREGHSDETSATCLWCFTGWRLNIRTGELTMGLPGPGISFNAMRRAHGLAPLGEGVDPVTYTISRGAVAEPVEPLPPCGKCPPAELLRGRTGIVLLGKEVPREAMVCQEPQGHSGACVSCPIGARFDVYWRTDPEEQFAIVDNSPLRLGARKGGRE